MFSYMKQLVFSFSDWSFFYPDYQRPAVKCFFFLVTNRTKTLIPSIPNSVLVRAVCKTKIKLSFYWEQTPETLKEEIQMVLPECDHTLRDCFFALCTLYFNRYIKKSLSQLPTNLNI